MPHLSLSLLGSFEATLDGKPIATFGTDKTRALLAFLAVEAARPYRRAELAGMLWPDLPEKKAAHNLSQTLLRLRRALREPDPPALPFLLITPQEIQFNPRSDYRLDVALFRELIAVRRQHHHSPNEICSVCIQWLQQAVNLYRGDLLSGFFVRDCIGFEEWRLVLQEALHGQAMETLDRLAVYHQQRGEYEQTQKYARRQVALEPWREQAHLQLIRALVGQGQSGTALEQYETYRRTLARELGLKPSAEATALYEQIRAVRAGKAELPASPAKSISNLHLSISPGGERRQITALVCGRGNLIGNGDPEEIYNMLAVCEGPCQSVCQRFGGYRLQRHGGACLIYFGHPQAYEDAARRAIHTAVAMVDRLKGQPYPICIGIHTGMMVVRKYGRRREDYELVGEVPTIARGCQSLAKPGEVVITADTERLARGWFDCRALGPRLLPATAGVADSIELYQVVGELSIPSRLDWLAQMNPLTSFVGRESQLARLTACWQQVEQGKGQVVLLSGEAGIGKSRLVWELKRNILGQTAELPHLVESEASSSRSILWLESRCSSYYQNTSLYPVLGWLEHLLGFAPGDSLEAKRDKLAGTLTHFELDHPAAIWLLSLLFELPGEGHSSQSITTEQREQMRQIFVALLQKRAAEQQVALVLEDLHWSDPSTLEWLAQSFDSLTAMPCLTVFTFRPTFTPAWLPQPHLLPLALDPLNSAEAGLMVTHLAGDELLDDKIRRHIVKQTDGIPLFVEEMTKAVLESGRQTGEISKTSSVLDLPVTLRDSLMARLDHLGPAKETAQWAAVLGRDFLYPVLQAVAPFDQQRLQADLAQLIEAELIYPQDQAPYTNYIFKHSLVQEVAYTSLLKRTRQQYHRQIAETLTAQFPHTAESQPELLAQHYTQAGLKAQAVDYWLRAGEHATIQGAPLEARTFFNQALELIEPVDREQRWRALCGREAVLDMQGDRPAQQADLAALLELAEAFNDDARRAEVYLRQLAYAGVQGDYQATLPLAEAASAAAHRAGNPTLELQALTHQTQALIFSRELAAARQVVEEILIQVQRVEDDPVRARALTVAAHYYMECGDLVRSVQFQSQSIEVARQARNHIAEIMNSANLSLIYINLGLYSQAGATLEAGLARAELLDDRRLHANTLLYLGRVYWLRGERERAQQMEEQALQELTAIGDAYGEATCLAYLGYIFEGVGDLALAATHLRQARAGFARIGMDGDQFEAQAVEARVALAQGRREEARQLALEVWQRLVECGPEGMEQPALAYGCVADVFSEVEPPELDLSIRQVIEAGYRELMHYADKIGKAEWRQSFLENVAANRALVERWERLQEEVLRLTSQSFVP